MSEWEERKRREAKKRIVPSKNRNSDTEHGQKDSEAARREERKKRIQKREKKGSRFYQFVVAILFIAIVVMGFYVLFFVQKMSLSGNEYYGGAETTNWIKEDPYAVNSLYLYGKYNYTEVELPPHLESLTVRLEAPWSVEILVKEKTMIGGVELPDRYAYFDKTGMVVYESELPLEDIPLIEGIEVEETILYEKVPVEDDEIFGNVLIVTKTLEENEISIDSLSCGSGATIMLGIGDITVQLGDDDLENKIIQIPAVLEKIGDQEGTLHLENFDVNDGTISFVRKNAEN